MSRLKNFLSQIGNGVLIALFVEFVKMIVSGVLKYFGIGIVFPFDLLQSSIPIWVALFIITVVISASYLTVIRGYSREIVPFVAIGRRRPEYNVKEGYVTFFGVNWHVYYGSSTPWSDPYGFVESGPLCPKCNYEMDTIVKRKLFRRKEYWRCLLCRGLYECPKDVRDVEEAVVKFVESYHRPRPPSSKQ
jgi:hypothetical protein